MAKYTKCCVPGCGHIDMRCRMFPMPFAKKRWTAWARLISRYDLIEGQTTNRMPKDYRICKLHLNPNTYEKKKLTKDAVPTRYLPICTINVATQTGVLTQQSNSNIEQYIAKLDISTVPGLEEYLEMHDEQILTSSAIGLIKNFLANEGIIMYDSASFRYPHNKCPKSIGTQTTQHKEKDDLDQNTTNYLSLLNPNSSHQQESEVPDIKFVKAEHELINLENEITNLVTSKLHSSKESEPSAITADIKDAAEDLDSLFKSIFKDDFLKIKNTLKKKHKNYEYFVKFRLYCLNMYYKGPKAYKLFKNYYSLPTEQKLFDTKLKLGAGVNHNYITMIAQQLNKMPEKAKYITIYLDEIPLTKNLYYDIRNDEIIGYHDVNGTQKLELAETAIILRIKGFIHAYEQLIGYVLSSNEIEISNISSWLETIIHQLFNVGFVVFAVVSNRNFNMINLAKSKGVSPENPFFMIGNKKIFYIFDIPQLMISLRNELLNSDFVLDEENFVSWEHVKAFHNNQKLRKFSLAPKITEAHMDPPPAQMMNETLMKQVFSYAVAAAMSADIQSGYQASEASGTANFILNMNDLYDILSSSKARDPHKFLKPFIGADYQIDCLKNAIAIFQNILVFDANTEHQKTEVDCFAGLVISIQAILQLSLHLVSHDIPSFYTKKLHKNSDKMIFELSKQQTPEKKSKVLTPIQFKRSFCKLALKKLLNNPRSVSDDNLKSMILGVESENEENLFSLLEEYFPNGRNSVALSVGTTDYRTSNTFTDLHKYILNKCSTVHTCDVLKQYTSNNKKVIEKEQREDSVKFTAIMVESDPPEDFVKYLKECERTFVSNFDSFAPQKNVGVNLLTALRQLPPIEPCPCFPLDYLHKLFIRLSIYNCLKSRNKVQRELKMEALSENVK